MSKRASGVIAAGRRQFFASGVLLLVAVGGLWLVGSGCDGCDFFDSDGIGTSNEADTVEGDVKEVNLRVVGWASGDGRSHRGVDIDPGSVPAGEKVDVFFDPADGATDFFFVPSPENPDGPPPFRWPGVPVGDGPQVAVAYTNTGDAEKGVDTVTVVTGAGGSYSRSYAAGPGESGESFPPALHGGDLPAVPEATDPLWFRSHLWFFEHSTPLGEDLCSIISETVQRPEVFFAIHFPVAPTGGDMTSYPDPVVVRGGFEDFPRLTLLRYQPYEEMLHIPLRPAPERFEFAENHLPPREGWRWTAITAADQGVTCPPGIDVEAGKWEFKSEIALDLGDDGCPGCEVQAWACWDGAISSGLARMATASLRSRGLRAMQADGAYCVGPVIIQSFGENAPRLNISGPNFSMVEPPQRVELPHYIFGPSASDVVLSVSSSLGATEWGLFRDREGTQPIVGPVNLPGFLDFWVIGDVPEGAEGLDVIAVTASSASVGGPPVRVNSFVQAGIPDLPPPAEDQEYWLQVASRASGLQQSQWRTDLGLLNAGDGPVTANLRYHAAGGVLTRQQAVAPGQQLILADVVGLLGGSGSAALQVVSNRPLKVSSRTYNLLGPAADCAPSGTFGQNYDAFTSEQGLGAGQSAWLTQLTENAAYRTNIALTNMGSGQAKATVALFDGAGGAVGSYSVTLAPGQYRQETRPFFNKAGQNNLARGYAVVTVTEGAGVLASASVVDNVTNDPTTMPMLRSDTAPAVDAWVQVAAHAPGLNQSQWRTDLGVLNPGDQPAVVQVRFHKGSSPKQSQVTVAPGQQAILVDVVDQIPESGSAALQVVATQPMVASSRTYNQVSGDDECFAGGTFGQNYDAFTVTTALQSGDVAHLTQLQENAAYRTNVALTNTGAEAARVEVVLYNGEGAQVGQYTANLNPGQYRQETRPFFNRAGQDSLVAGYARVRVLEGSGIIASASVVDNQTNDPTTMPALR